MSDAAPNLPVLADPPRRDRRIVITAAISAAVHLLVLGLILLPRIEARTPPEPPPINVDLVPPSELPSLPEPPSSLQPSSSVAPPSSELESSEEPTSSAEPSSAPASSAEPLSAEPASSEIASSEPASASSAEPASSAPPPSASASASEQPPAPQARPIVIPVGPSEAASDEASSAEDQSASEETSSTASEMSSAEASSAVDASQLPALTTTGTGASDAIGDASSSVEPPSSASAEPPPITGALHKARQFYLDAILGSPTMARARDAIRKLPPEKRLAQTCNIEAVGQLGNAGRDFRPDAVVADAFAKPAIAGTSFTVNAGAFRSQQKWYAFSYKCTLSKDLGAVESFTFRVGGDVTATLKARLGD